ncbi:MAG: YeeE/YedE family protein [Acidobacteria bacterium]|nr:MAG: YeeE/YedE family protein [Acidobacteriota bacterium]REK09241.1 MAG: YeeE/YedE family protein [Acidobacteriota bacterium]
MSDFVPGSSYLSSLIGGALIGTAAVLLMALLGRIAGISGILGGLQTAAPGDRAWRAAFLVGLPLGALIAALVWAPPEQTLVAGWPTIVLGGLLVGIGTRMGSGCTSGHGVCGLARMSRRSLVATPTFMLAAAGTVLVVRHVL